jgi:uncharacterized protein YndB with AHSA1/START domain
MSESNAVMQADPWAGMDQAAQAMGEFGVVIERRTVRFERVLPGPIERVWAYLTEPDKRARWLAAGPMELRVGGRVALTFHNSELSPRAEPPPEKYADCAEKSGFEGRLTRCEPPRLLSYTWGAGQDSEVTFELTPRGEDVLLVLTHRRLGDRATMVSVGGGWHTHLGILADRLEGREPRPFWSTHARLEAEYERRLPAD